LFDALPCQTRTEDADSGVRVKQGCEEREADEVISVAMGDEEGEAKFSAVGTA